MTTRIPPDNTLLPGVRNTLVVGIENAPDVPGVIPLAHKLAGKYARMIEANDENMHDDLFAAAITGAIHAAAKWQPGRGAKFVTYAYWYMRQAVQNECAQLSGGGLVSMAGASAKRDWRGKRSAPKVYSADVPSGEDDCTAYHFLACGAWDDSLECWGEDTWDKLESKLPGESIREAFRLCFRQGMTYEDAARQMRVSRARIGQYIRTALERLRSVVEEMETT